MSVVFVQFTWNIYNIYSMYRMKCYMQTTILKPNKRQEPSEVNGQNQSQVKPKPKAKAKSQKPKAKWARKWEILAPKCMQNTDFSSKMQQIARKAAPAWKTKKKKNLPSFPAMNSPEFFACAVSKAFGSSIKFAFSTISSARLHFHQGDPIN